MACETEAPAAGELRARRIGCSSEVPTGGDGRKGDWLLASSRLRAAVRDGYGALTQLGAGGGTLVDLASEDGEDRIIEVFALQGGAPLAQVDVGVALTADGADIVLDGVDSVGLAFNGAYRLMADGAGLELSGFEAVGVVLPAGSEVVGQVVETPTGPVGFDGDVHDEGGWLRVDGPAAIHVGTADAVHQALWPDGVDVEGVAEGDWVEALDGLGPQAAVLARLAVADGAFAGRLPAQTAGLRATAEGAADGPTRAIDDTGALAPGAGGAVLVRLRDRSGTDLPGTLWWRPTAASHQEGRWTAAPLPPGGGAVPIGSGAIEGLVTAGPLYDTEAFTAIPPSRPQVDVVLERCCTPALLADLSLTAWPDRSERLTGEARTHAAMGRGVGFAVLTAADEVAPAALAERDDRWIAARAGSEAASPTGPVWSWPWTQNSLRSAHGAVAWAGLSAQDVLAAADGTGSRWTVVGADWLAEAGPPAGWSPQPAAIRVDGVDDVEAVAAVFDLWATPALVGPLTWIEGLEGVGSWRDAGRSTEEVEAALLGGRTVATNGPRIVLRVDRLGPGESVPISPRPTVAHLRVEAPRWMELHGAALVTSGGRTLAEWELDGREPLRLDERVAVDGLDWVMAICWGAAGEAPLAAGEWWAMTSPIWLARP